MNPWLELWLLLLDAAALAWRVIVTAWWVIVGVVCLIAALLLEALARRAWNWHRGRRQSAAVLRADDP